MKKSILLMLGVFVGFNGAVVLKVNAGISTSNLVSINKITVQNRNNISGFVFTQSRAPVPDIYVELLSDLGSTISRIRTNGSGQFAFRGLPDGQFRVKVLTYGTDYQEQEQAVSLIRISAVPGSGSTSEQIDFYLKLKLNVNSGPLAAPGVVFAQDIPDNAKKLYQEGISLLNSKKEKEGFDKLKNALEVFPDYYLALDRLGTEYVIRGYYRPAYVLLNKAVEINPRSFSSTFGLGLTMFRLKLNDKAIEYLQKSTEIYNQSPNAYLWLGVALHEKGNLTLAETAITRANKLSKGEAPEVHWQLARLYNDQKRYQEAVKELELFLKYDPQAADSEKVKETIESLRKKTTPE